ncbi:MAG: hypothetical protein J0M04_14045 [Verrucomicrobia bacterium]|nr:hypothetical protein [Verrucomicrobiota bacterium]
MNTRNITVLAVLIAGLPLAIWLGISIAQQQVMTVAWIVGSLFLIACLALGRHVWLLIPASLGFKGMINLLPGGPEPWHLMTAVVGFFTLLRILSRRQKLNYHWTFMDTSFLLVGFTIFQAFARNPTGLSILGGDLAGGKVYIMYGVAFVAVVLLGIAEADRRDIVWAVLLLAAGTIVDGMIGTASQISQSFGFMVLPYYSGIDLQVAVTENYTAALEESRLWYIGTIGGVLSLVACTYWRPLAALDLTKPWRALTALLGVVTSLLSGYRQQIAYLMLNFVLGSIIRKKPLDAIVVMGLGLVLVGGVAVVVPPQMLPYAVQRVFTVIPGYKATSRATVDAEGSMNGRFEMWREVMKGNKYIKNKLLGDGFGFSAKERAMQNAFIHGDKRAREAMTKTDMYLATGMYHGFHVETIRCTGAVGLVAATIALFAMMALALKQIRHFRRDGYGMVMGSAFFLSLPFLYKPFYYWLVYGSYQGEFQVLIATAGLLKMLDGIRRSEVADLGRQG